MSAAVLNLVGEDAIEQGVPFPLELRLNDGATPTPNALDLTGWTFIATLTQPFGGTFSIPFTASVPAPVTGVVHFEITEELAAALPASPQGEASLKLDILATTNTGTPIHLVTGRVQVKPTAPSLL